MKTGIVTTLIALCLPVSVFATTLRLSTDVDLLVLDGKKVSSSLLRGAWMSWRRPSANNSRPRVCVTNP
ncbi:hypothetical protein GUI26_07735 [Escherichia coli]|nr:hypothetical protein [Escherichia coli]